jgi:hypothetical protein
MMIRPTRVLLPALSLTGCTLGEGPWFLGSVVLVLVVGAGALLFGVRRYQTARRDTRRADRRDDATPRS